MVPRGSSRSICSSFTPIALLIAPPAGMKRLFRALDGISDAPTNPATYQIGNVGSMNRLWLDGKLIVDDFILHDPKPTTRHSNLKKDIATRSNWNTATEASAPRLVWLRLVADPIPDAVALAKQADVVVAVVGITSQLEGEEMKWTFPALKAETAPASICPKKKKIFWKR